MSADQEAHLLQASNRLTQSAESPGPAKSALSENEKRNATALDGRLKGVLEIFWDQYDPKVSAKSLHRHSIRE